jgi:hypothetical protein
MKSAPVTRDYFRATGAELKEWAPSDPAAEAEAARRKANRAAKSEAKKAA